MKTILKDQAAPFSQDNGNVHPMFCQCEDCTSLREAMNIEIRLDYLFDFANGFPNAVDITHLKIEAQHFNKNFPRNDWNFDEKLSFYRDRALNDKLSLMQYRKVLNLLNRFDRYKRALSIPSKWAYLSALFTSFLNRNGYQKIRCHSAITDIQHAYQGCKTEIKEQESQMLKKLPTINTITWDDIVCCEQNEHLALLLKDPMHGRNNLFFSGSLDCTHSITHAYCTKNPASYQLIDFEHPKKVSEEKKENIIKRTIEHQRYGCIKYTLLKNMKHLNLDDHYHASLLNILDFVTTFNMTEPQQNITIIQHFKQDTAPDWVTDIIADIITLNRFCLGTLLFTDSHLS